MNTQAENEEDALIQNERVQSALDSLNELPFSTAIIDLDTTADERAFAKIDVEGFWPRHLRGEERSAHVEYLGERDLIRFRINIYTGDEDGPETRRDKAMYEARFVDGQWTDFFERNKQ